MARVFEDEVSILRSAKLDLPSTPTRSGALEPLCPFAPLPREPLLRVKLGPSPPPQDLMQMLISSLGHDAAREKVIDFSIAYAPFFSAIFGPEHLAVAKPEDLASKSIAVTRATIEDSALTTIAPDTTTITRYDDNAATEVAYLSGQAELIATANFTAAEILAKSPLKKTAIKFVLQSSPCYIDIPKRELRLLGRVNQIIAAARNDGSLSKISELWLKAPLGDPEHPEGITHK